MSLLWAEKSFRQAHTTQYAATSLQRLHTGMTKAQVACEFGISRETLYHYLRVPI
jgi:hypothetical protein